MTPLPERKPREPRDVTMHRVHVGVTGLAAVFLLTLLAASLFALLGQDPHNSASAPANTAAANQLAQEPLAELGVAPGNAPKPPAKVAPRPAPPAIAPARKPVS